MRYTDNKGRARTLTPVQALYLSTAHTRHQIDAGWGGLSSTLTVRLLRERGLITLDDLLYKPWRITGLTKLGGELLARWNERNA
ncbi:hypothetical protein ACH4T9_13040 [Micromonospora sp. NPDC020750]|uniref:hypothetical protein n=1 Tax=unclassified Micromonospora TaxID=2617518 RepID=UPI0037B1D981